MKSINNSKTLLEELDRLKKVKLDQEQSIKAGAAALGESLHPASLFKQAVTGIYSRAADKSTLFPILASVIGQALLQKIIKKDASLKSILQNAGVAASSQFLEKLFGILRDYLSEQHPDEDVKKQD